MTLFQRLMVTFGFPVAPEADKKKPAEHKVGEYVADYSPVSPEEIAAAEEDALAEFYKHSRPVPAKPKS